MIQNLLIGTQTIQPLAMKSATAQTGGAAGSGQSFGTYLEDALNQVAAQEQQAKDMNNKFVLGEVNIDEAMISSQQALLSLQLTTQVRNKVIEAYQEIMRTQI
ncbi:flagellar hook-basal body complex protein FliE [Paenibacillus sp. FSL R7-0331]|uniref:flagellar hook-basal body complex protein FliE n=1 Tax=Paenibacillus sp. FSL R7-0331 TaxID=1536773 RepID=UPI0004F7F859|nr:flagellar hook-basal body complex protein FliE [Paenibacillus sp. FSL R7-0331]AIQ53335.1 flagellar hook-basal body protein FliE [Paenibacillus sp. FSL R7-0331]